jgi:diguanylate cyclase (GGDEF)-like protein
MSINQLLSALARLSALREREALEDALVELVRRDIVPQSHWVRLVRAIGEPGQLHWLIRATYVEELDTTERDQVWGEWSKLPPFSDFPHRQQAVSVGDVVQHGSAPCLSVFPLERDPSLPSVLEIQSNQAIAATTCSTIEAVLAIYRNLIGLLDYGEKDALTGLLNRKSFDGAFVRAAMQQDALEQTLDHPDRRTTHDQQSYWMAVLDIDHFKRVNDTFGHLIGDEVLVLMARIMRTALRQQDQLYRFGGEEFVVMMRCPTHARAEAVLERFRHTVQTFEFPQVGRVTVSVGFTQLRGDDTPDLAFNRADKAVYHAKESGRNRVCSFAQLLASGSVIDTPSSEDDIEFF